ncbi:hypothetical protein V2J09_022372 [Rumex salicifolius]
MCISNVERICLKLGFENCFGVDAQGQSGGLWLLWQHGLGLITIVSSSSQFIHVVVDFGKGSINLITVYAALTPQRRRLLWDELSGILENGGNGVLSPHSVEFRQWIHQNSLIDLGFKGNRFTWIRGRTTATRIAKRLDREASVAHLPSLSSNHALLYLQLSPERKCDPR